MNSPYETAIVILAAGASRRLGFPKQLAKVKDKPLLAHAIENALGACSAVYVVLGANEITIKPMLKDYPIQILSNSNWEEGLASSIRCGVKPIESTYRSIILALGDQPFIPPNHFLEMISLWKKRKFSVIGSVYASCVGVPALFDREVFGDLQMLQGDQGAKALFNQYSGKLSTISCQEAQWDVDTLEQLNHVKSVFPPRVL